MNELELILWGLIFSLVSFSSFVVCFFYKSLSFGSTFVEREILFIRGSVSKWHMSNGKVRFNKKIISAIFLHSPSCILTKIATTRAYSQSLSFRKGIVILPITLFALQTTCLLCQNLWYILAFFGIFNKHDKKKIPPLQQK